MSATVTLALEKMFHAFRANHLTASAVSQSWPGMLAGEAIMLPTRATSTVEAATMEKPEASMAMKTISPSLTLSTPGRARNFFSFEAGWARW